MCFPEEFTKGQNVVAAPQPFNGDHNYFAALSLVKTYNLCGKQVDHFAPEVANGYVSLLDP